MQHPPPESFSGCPPCFAGPCCNVPSLPLQTWRSPTAELRSWPAQPDYAPAVLAPPRWCAHPSPLGPAAALVPRAAKGPTPHPRFGGAPRAWVQQQNRLGPSSSTEVWEALTIASDPWLVHPWQLHPWQLHRSRADALQAAHRRLGPPEYRCPQDPRGRVPRCMRERSPPLSCSPG